MKFKLNIFLLTLKLGIQMFVLKSSTKLMSKTVSLIKIYSNSTKNLIINSFRRVFMKIMELNQLN